MASLQKVTQTSRHILVIGLLIVVGIFVLISGVNFIKSLHPTPPPPPTVAFGKLPPITFPQNVTNVQFTFTLDTLSGNLPDLGDRTAVYKMHLVSPTLSSLDNAKALVANMGYTGDPTKISDTDYEWTNTDDLPKTLLLNIFTNNFAISSPYYSNQDVLQANNLPDQNGAINTVMTFLQNASLTPTDIDTNKTKATLLSINNDKFTQATSLANTQIIQVDLFQNDVNKLPIFYPDPTHSTMSLYVGGGSNAAQIVLANFNHQIIGSENATYPIITAQQALDMLKKGEAYIASYDTTGTSISIHNIVLGYYMSDQQQQYLEPIIVFEGSNGFYAYVPAITSAWISK